MASSMDKMMDRFRVKVIKTTDDDRTSLEGEVFISPRNPEHDGTDIGGDLRPYVIVPAHRADYIKSLFPSYRISEPFIPGVDTPSTSLQCPKCDFVAKTAAGLKTHMAAHG